MIFVSRLILFCVESNASAQTDYMYVKETLKQFYKHSVKVTYRPIFMAGKTNYNSKSVLKQIKDASKGYRGEVTVIYCIDTDDYDISYTDQKTLDDITQYCTQEKNHELVLFCRDVEDVFWGKQVNKGEKREFAIRFVSSKEIAKVKRHNLEQKKIIKKSSNILLVLDKYFERS